jgi:anti-sigma B factor antagonist
MTHPTHAPAFSIRIERSGDTATVHLHGRLVSGVCNDLYKPVAELIPTSKRVVLELKELTHMDSLGLGTVVRLYVSAKSAGCCLDLINIGPRIRDLLGMTHLLSVLTDMCEQGVNLRF